MIPILSKSQLVTVSQTPRQQRPPTALHRRADPRSGPRYERIPIGDCLCVFEVPGPVCARALGALTPPAKHTGPSAVPASSPAHRRPFRHPFRHLAESLSV